MKDECNELSFRNAGPYQSLQRRWPWKNGIRLDIKFFVSITNKMSRFYDWKLIFLYGMKRYNLLDRKDSPEPFHLAIPSGWGIVHTPSVQILRPIQSEVVSCKSNTLVNTLGLHIIDHINLNITSHHMSGDFSISLFS